MQKTQGGLGRGLGALLPPPTQGGAPVMSAAIQSIVAPVQAAPRVVVAPVPVKHVQEIPEKREERDDRILHVSPRDIVPNPRQPRHHFAAEELTDLMASIQEHGILQPLIVSDRKDGTYELIAGERRLRSAEAVGLSTVPVVVRNATDRQKLEWALIENIQRADLNVVEEAKAYQALMSDFHLTQEEVAGRVGKSRSQITNTLRLLELPTDMLAAVVDGKITKSHARTLLAEPNDDRRRALFARMLHGGVTVRQAESSASGRRQGDKEKDPNILALESQLRERLGTKVTIDVKASSSIIGIHCYSKEDLAAMVRRLID